MELRFGSVVFNLGVSEAISRSVLLERSGFDSVWVTDVLFEGGPELVLPDIFPLMTAIGLNTKSVVVGSAVIDALSRHPAKIATATATIDNMLNGRTIFGIGGGETINHEPFGIPTTEVYAKLRETVQILKLLWTTDHMNPASFGGKYYRLRDAYIKIKPKTKPHPRIYLPAFGPRMLAMTGELADGWLPFNHTADSYEATLNGPIRAAAEKVGRSLSVFDPANIFIASVSREPEKAAEAAKKEAKNWLVWSPDILRMIVPQLKHTGKRQPFIKSRAREDVEAQSRLAQEIPDEVVLKTAVWGTPENCIQQLEGFIKSGLRHPILFFVPTPSDSVENMIQLFGSKVVRYFKSK